MALSDLKNMGEFKLIRPPDPEGKIQSLVSVLDGVIVIDFGRALWWIGYDPIEAEKFANDILQAVRTARTLHVP